MGGEAMPPDADGLDIRTGVSGALTLADSIAISKGKGRSPDGDAEAGVTNIMGRAVGMAVVSSFVWIVYLSVLALMGAETRAAWLALTDGSIGAVGSMVPILSSFERRLPQLHLEEWLPLLRHIWGGFWLFQLGFFLFQLRLQMRPLLKKTLWARAEWGFKPSWGQAFFLFLFASVLLLFSGGFLQPSLMGGRSIKFLVYNVYKSSAILYICTSFIINLFCFSLIGYFVSSFLFYFRREKLGRFGYQKK